MKDPKTPAEWQEAVNQAEFFRLLYDAKLYGLITGGPRINAARCDEILERGRARGYRPLPQPQLLELFVHHD